MNCLHFSFSSFFVVPTVLLFSFLLFSFTVTISAEATQTQTRMRSGKTMLPAAQTKKKWGHVRMWPPLAHVRAQTKFTCAQPWYSLDAWTLKKNKKIFKKKTGFSRSCAHCDGTEGCHQTRDSVLETKTKRKIKTKNKMNCLKTCFGAQGSANLDSAAITAPG